MFKPYNEYLWSLHSGRRIRTSSWRLMAGNTTMKCWSGGNFRKIHSIYVYGLSDPAEESDFRAALLKETELEVVHQASGYLTLSTCNNGAGAAGCWSSRPLPGRCPQ